ncbi:MAG: Hsp20/alpha crystallin family protein [Deltaproteobacteria bacterium]|nr:Hsp20/alpha crystallin family protein [Candidatus Zymogenaceae bacterium]
MALIRWDPFRDLLTLQDRMDRLFEESISRNRVFEQSFASGVWSPAVDIYETNDEIVLKAELPGLKKDDVSIEITDNTLILTGERTFEKDIKEENYHRIERSYGSFSRTFSLPTTVDQSGVSAKFIDGILEIHIPKAEKSTARVIEIKET